MPALIMHNPGQDGQSRTGWTKWHEVVGSGQDGKPCARLEFWPLGELSPCRVPRTHFRDYVVPVFAKHVLNT